MFTIRTRRVGNRLTCTNPDDLLAQLAAASLYDQILFWKQLVLGVEGPLSMMHDKVFVRWVEQAYDAHPDFDDVAERVNADYERCNGPT